jgi:hypothetical protein
MRAFFRPKQDSLDRHLRVERVGLEHHADAAFGLGSDQVTLLPLMKIWPSETSSRPAMQLSRVDLPQPEEPEKHQELAFIDVEIEVLEHFTDPN